jgi:sterol desaturase/sphingolipid hydroxylase (fatty acid hydroxylase superfamily)
VEVFLISLVSAVRYQVVGVALFLPFELAFPKEKASFGERSSGFIFLLAGALVIAVVSAVMAAARSALEIEPVVFRTNAGSPILAAIVLALWIDFQFYVMHRLQHRFLWRFHAVHHSIRHLSAANSYHHWSEPIWLSLIALPLLFVNVKIAPTMAALTFLFRVQQFYIHSSSKPHFGPLRRLLVDNRYHRIHHSLSPEHHHKNFGAMTPLWDWLFGTLYMPRSHEWPKVGLEGINEPTSLKEWSALPFRIENTVHGGIARYASPSAESTASCEQREQSSR